VGQRSGGRSIQDPRTTTYPPDDGKQQVPEFGSLIRIRALSIAFGLQPKHAQDISDIPATPDIAESSIPVGCILPGHPQYPFADDIAGHLCASASETGRLAPDISNAMLATAFTLVPHHRTFGIDFECKVCSFNSGHSSEESW
jgi:hypothetical protein